jgi:hypothetical protein
MKAGSEEYKDEDLFEDLDEITEITGISEDRYVVIGDSDEDAPSPPDNKGHMLVERMALGHGMLV